VVNVIVVEAICDHPGIKAVTFVGSTPIAKLVSTRAQANHKRVVALGGAKNHLVAAPDCNITVAAQDIVNSYSGCAGQRCMAASVLLTIGPQNALVNKIVELSKGIKPGNKSGEMGPVIDKASLDKIERYLAQAQELGAEILVDGRKWKGMEGTHEGGWWIGPTVIRHKNKDDPAIKVTITILGGELTMFQDEIFGPVLSILAVDTKEEAIAIENASPFGNAAAIYTTSGLVAEWFTEHFSTGMVGVNIGIPVPREPFSFGGVADSRWGTQVDITGEGGIEFFTSRKKVTSRWTESADGFFASSSSSTTSS
jgi:acyl-CoA reductase-like NAD-dependent aldehyde dehydrogenase